VLSIVPTPIGNLRDITLRALDVLREADIIVCEDTRQTQKLLQHYEIQKPLWSFHEHSPKAVIQKIIEALKEGKKMALVSDSGTPLISDPGFPLLREALREKIQLEALPGPTAFVTALAASGLPANFFTFWGFLPAKSAARKKQLSQLAEREETLIFYESPFRLLTVLKEMKEIFGNREAVVARELTKKFEEIARGYLSELIEKFASKKVLGEIVILVAGKNQKEVLHS
jgi:16S rRNA (cytidine1402-2'-O)-methyltransferase